MRVFRQRYKGRDGATKLSAKWYVELKDHNGDPQRIAGFTDKGKTTELGNRLQKVVAARVMRETPNPELSAWLETLPGDLRGRLLELGLLDSRSAANSKPVVCHVCNSTGRQTSGDGKGQPCACNGEHLSDFRQALLNRGNIPDHADLITARVRIIFEGCKFTSYGDISASHVEDYLADLRNGNQPATTTAETAGDGKKKRRKPSIGAQTSNFYLVAIKSFCKWMVKDRRARKNPVAHLDGLNVKLDRRHDRRNLTTVELSKLLTTTAPGPVRHKMTGRARVMLYRVAMETGLRRKELRTLTPSAFQLEGEELTVGVDAGRSKNRKATLLPIREELATELRQ